jgi:DivIVA domain-containing protein
VSEAAKGRANVLAQLDRAADLVQRRYYKEANEALLSISPSTWGLAPSIRGDVSYLRGLIEVGLGRYGSAARLLANAIRRGSRRRDNAAYILGQLARAAGHRREAVSLYASALVDNPLHQGALAGLVSVAGADLASILHRQGGSVPPTGTPASDSSAGKSQVERGQSILDVLMRNQSTRAALGKTLLRQSLVRPITQEIAQLRLPVPARGDSGYDRREVDAFVGRVADALQGKSSLTPAEVHNVKFHMRKDPQDSYQEAAVDDLLNRVERTLTLVASNA